MRSLTGRAKRKAGPVLAGLLIALAPAWPDGITRAEQPERPPPWGDRWEPPGPPEMPEPETPVDAATFAADCNDDGMVRVGGDLEVRGGGGTLTTDCHVDLAGAATLTLIDLTLAGPYAFSVRCGAAARLNLAHSYLTLLTRVAIGGEGGATLAIHDSEVSSMAGGAIDIVLAGTGAGIEVIDSMIMSDGGVRIDVAPRADGGRIEVRRATLTAAGRAANALALTASLDGLGGEARVLESELIGSALIAIESGAQGRTEVRDSVLETTGEVRIATGDGGKCEAAGNEPALTCPPPIDGEQTAVATAVNGG